MKLTQTLSTLLLAAALAVGCSKKTDAPAADKAPEKPIAAEPAAATTPPPAADKATPPPAAPATTSVTIASDDEYMTKGKALMGKLTDIFKADGTDCDKLAADIDTLHGDPNMAAADAYEKAHPDVKKKFDAATKPETKAFETLATPAITACAKNQKLMDALSKFGN